MFGNVEPVINFQGNLIFSIWDVGFCHTERGAQQVVRLEYNAMPNL